ncbi:MAG TPA: glycosyltransferase family 2 protein [Polyangiaceae bacterium]|nr:glycosyltransferase family 2 protein [Polyangiaceae bacterium]
MLLALLGSPAHEAPPLLDSARIAVIVPAHREERLLGRMLARVPAFVDAIYVVDDASPDGTLAVARASNDPRVRALSHATNQGVGAAIVTGYREAIADDHDVLAVMAGDDQMDPDDLEPLIRRVLSGADYAKGNRFRHPESRRMPFLRRLGGEVLSFATRRATGLRVTDTQCGYTALCARAARALPLAELWPRYGYPNDLLLLLAAHGMRVAEVPVRPVYADEASGLRPWHVISILTVIARRYARVARSTKTSA